MHERLGRIWPPGIRLQLTLWYTSIFVGLLLLTGIVLYVRLQTKLIETYDEPLKVRTEQLIADITNDDGMIDPQDIAQEVSLLEQETLRNNDRKADVNFDALVRILNTKGQALVITPAFHELQVPTLSVMQPLHGDPWQGTVPTADGYQVRLYSTRLMSKSTLFGVIQVGQSLTPLNTSLQKVVEELLLIAPFAVMLGIIGSHWLATRAFVPIYHLTSIAEEISAGDLQRRVPVPEPKDEVQQLALTFNKMIGQLDQAFMQQRRFVADASHELRTPVAAIRSMTDVALAQSLTAEECIAVVGNVNAVAERLGWLIRDLLLLARSDEGQVPLDYELVRLDRLVSDVVATLEPLAVERGIVLQVLTLEPATVRGDISRLIQCVINLLDNALTYTNAGGRVALRVEMRERCGCIVVQDTGIGIAPEDRLHIFERFYRADSVPTRKAGGSGLGLAIVEWVTRAHWGSIQVESQVGQGSTFTLSFPLAQDY
ncbi:MAG: HAMP domain-containing protein [Herpetosiphonaceae bacterium]|nr:HAMP domain-containing protein [Herpetosiphonaceae bacterium]